MWVEDGVTVQAVYMPVTAPAPSSALNFAGKQIKIRFLTQTDLTNVLTWQASADPTVVSYNLTRNGVSIATIAATAPLTYEDHNRSPKQNNTYALTAVNASGGQSTPVFVTLP